MNWTQLIQSEMEGAYKAAAGLMDKVADADLDWKPATGENWMTMGQLLLHLATSCGFAMRGFVTGDWNPPADLGYPEEMSEGMLPAEKLPSAASVVWACDYLEKDRRVALECLESAGEDDLAGRLLAAPWDPSTERCLGQHCLNMVNHLHSHKSQLFYYLKLMGRKVNTLDLWGV